MAELPLQGDYRGQARSASFREPERMKDSRCWSSVASFCTQLLCPADWCGCHQQARVDDNQDLDPSLPSAAQSAPLPAPSNSIKPLQSITSSKSQHKTNGRGVTGTIFGYRKGKVTFCVQDDPKTSPSLLLELAMPTDILVREMASGLLRIALECETKTRHKLDDDVHAADGSVVSSKPLALIMEPVWTMYCNGRKVGFAIRRVCSDSDRLVLSVIEQVSMGAGVIPVDDQHRPLALSPERHRSVSKQSSRRTSPERNRSDGHRWFPSMARESRSSRTSPERERRMGGPGSRDQSYRSSPDHRYYSSSRDRPSYRSSPEHSWTGRDRRSSLEMRRVIEDRDTTPSKARSLDIERSKLSQQPERFEDRLKGGHGGPRRHPNGAATPEPIKSPMRSPRHGHLFEAGDVVVKVGMSSGSKTEPKSAPKSDRSEDEDGSDTATSRQRSGTGKEEHVSNGIPEHSEGEGQIGNYGPRSAKNQKDEDYGVTKHNRIDEHLPLSIDDGFLNRPSKLDMYNDLDAEYYRLHGHSQKPSQVPSEDLMYMRARYEHVVGSSDAESFHMINPDGTPGQELSIFFLRI